MRLLPNLRTDDAGDDFGFFVREHSQSHGQTALSRDRYVAVLRSVCTSQRRRVDLVGEAVTGVVRYGIKLIFQPHPFENLAHLVDWAR